MFCTKCGHPASDAAAFCEKCGAEWYSPPDEAVLSALQPKASESGEPQKLSEENWSDLPFGEKASSIGCLGVIVLITFVIVQGIFFPATVPKGRWTIMVPALKQDGHALSNTRTEPFDFDDHSDHSYENEYDCESSLRAELTHVEKEVSSITPGTLVGGISSDKSDEENAEIIGSNAAEADRVTLLRNRLSAAACEESDGGKRYRLP